MIYNNVLEMVGDTPVVRLNRIAKGAKATVLAKLESFNPGNSVKDRAALAMITDAEKRGLLKPGGTIIEATSGNTGIGLAMAAAVKGYRTKLVITKAISEEKVALLKAYGAEVLVRGEQGLGRDEGQPPEPCDEARQGDAQLLPGQPVLQRGKPQGPLHDDGPRDLEADRREDRRVRGEHRHRRHNIRNIEVPQGEEQEHKDRRRRTRGLDLLGGKPKHYETEAIGQCFFPGTLDMKNIDEIMRVGDVDAFNTARRLAREEGIMAGESSGSAVYAAISVAKKLDGKKTVLALLPDTGRNYLSTMFSDDWMRRKFPAWRAPR